MLAFVPLLGMPEPRGCHDEPSQRAIIPSGVAPECVNQPAAINVGERGPAPSGSHDVKNAAGPGSPEPIGSQDPPSHWATLLMGAAPEAVKLPAATNRRAIGPSASGSQSSIPKTLELRPAPGETHAVPFHRTTL